MLVCSYVNVQLKNVLLKSFSYLIWMQCEKNTNNFSPAALNSVINALNRYSILEGDNVLKTNILRLFPKIV
jgi:hypothetical protein